MIVLILLNIFFGWSHVFHAKTDFKHVYKQPASSKSLQPVSSAGRGKYSKG